MNNNKAFSLIELLTVVAILLILVSIAFVAYNRYKESSYVSWTKAEMLEVLKLANMAKEYDGFYHQYIYKMGYRPRGKTYAVVGTDQDPGRSCCDQYPDPGIYPCEKNWRSGFLYYNCNESFLQTATDNITICKDEGYKRSCVDKDGNSIDSCCTNTDKLDPLKKTDFSSCSSDIPTSSWCDCDSFTVGAINVFKKELLLNQDGFLCVKDN